MHTADIIIFVVFLIANLIVGALARGKKQTFREFAIGNKNFSTATLVATIVATWASGSKFFNELEQTYSTGLYLIIAIIIGVPLGLLITGYIIAPRMGNFLNHVSMADAMGSVYGKGVQFVAAIGVVFRNIGFTAIQFKVISKILVALFHAQGAEVTYITIAAAAIVTLYSAFGGVKAVTFTDVIQFITFGTLLPVLALTIWNHIQDPHQILLTLQSNPNFSFSHVVKWDAQFIGTLALMSYVMTPSLPPELFQRMAMAKDIHQVKRSIAYSAGILFLIDLLIIWIAILLLTDNPHLKTHEVVGYMIEKHTYVGLKGFLGIGVIALAMSSADSALNSTAVIVANDILPTVKLIKQASVRAASMATFVLGFFATLLTLSIQNILQILFLAANFYMPIITVPMLLTIFGFRTSKRVIYIGMGAGAAMAAILLAYFKNVNSFFPGMLANLVFLLGSHYLLKEKGGWIKQERTGIYVTSAGWTWESFWKQVKSFQLVPYLEKRLPNKGYYYPLLAFYLLTATYFSLYNLSNDIQQHYLNLHRLVQYSTLIIATSLFGFTLRPTLLEKKGFLVWLWPSILLYTLFFVGGIIVMMSGFETTQVLVFMLNLVMAVLLSSWQLAIALATIGLIAATLVFNTFWGGIIPVQSALSIPFQVGYGLLLFSSVLIALFRFKQANQTLAGKHEYLLITHEATTKELVKALNTEARFVKALETEGVKELENTAQEGEKLVQYLAKVTEKVALPTDLQQDIIQFKDRVQTTAQYLSQAVHRATAYLQLQVTTISIKQLVDEALARLRLTELAATPSVTVKMEDSVAFKVVQADAHKLQELLVHAIVYTFSKLPHQQQPVVLGVEESQLDYATNSIQGYVKQVPAVRITVSTLPEPPTGEKKYLSNMEQSVWGAPIDQNNIHLLFAQRVLQAHYGYMAVEVSGQDITQVYVIPQNIREIRPKEMDIPELDPEAMLQVSDENYPGAKEQEADFLKSLHLESAEELALVHKALRFIKKYHGPVKRKSGEPFYLHPVMVARIVTSFTQDLDTILGALLHDVVEDTAITLPQIELMFNKDVKKIVDGVTHLDSLGKVVYRLQLGEHENIEQLLDAEDKRVLYVKLADRTHNMRTIQYHSSVAKQKKIASETLGFFVPVAKYLGLMDIAAELKAISSEVMKKQG
jgi:Na+/proline symporter